MIKAYLIKRSRFYKACASSIFIWLALTALILHFKSKEAYAEVTMKTPLKKPVVFTPGLPIHIEITVETALGVIPQELTIDNEHLWIKSTLRNIKVFNKGASTRWDFNVEILPLRTRIFTNNRLNVTYRDCFARSVHPSSKQILPDFIYKEEL